MTQKRRGRQLLLLIIAPALAWAGAVGLAPELGYHYGSKGTLDFIQYWAAFRLLLDGLNPYDPQLMYELQQQLGQHPGQTVMMWNPPWLLVLLAPVLILPFPAASLLWLVLSLALLLATAVLAARAVSAPSRAVPRIVLCATLFLPVWDNLSFGQLGILLAAAAAAFLLLVERRRDFLAGLVLTPLTLKPHLFLLPAIALLWWSLATRRLRVLSGAALGSGALIACLIVVAPGAPAQWLATLGEKPKAPGAVSIAEWKTAAVSGWVRSLLASADGIPPLWPMWAVPAAAMLVTFIWMARRAGRVSWRRDLPGLLCLSVATAPYGWLYDQSVLVLAHVLLAATALMPGAPLRHRAALLLPLLLLQLGLVICALVPGGGQHRFFWFPPALFLVWVWAGRRFYQCRSDRADERPAPNHGA